MSSSLVGIVVNISPYVVGLGRATSMKMMQVLDYVSRDRSLVTTEINAMITSNLVRAIDTLVEEHRSGHGSFSSFPMIIQLLTWFLENENVLWAVWKYGRTFEHLADLRIEADENFRSFAEGLRRHGLTEPVQSPDGTVLIPLIESSYIVEMKKRSLTRPDYQAGTWEQLGSPRVARASVSDFPLESRSRRGSRLTLEAEKVSIMSDKALGKKPEDGFGESIKDSSASNGDADIVSCNQPHAARNTDTIRSASSFSRCH